MRFTYLHIKNFKSVADMEIRDIENVLILVGRNNAGKSIALKAIRAIVGDYIIGEGDFNKPEGNISIKAKLLITPEDLKFLKEKGVVSKYKHYDLWFKEFTKRLPSYNSQTGELEFEFVYTRDGKIKYRDKIKKDNPYIKMVMPKIFFIDHFRTNTDPSQELARLGKRSGVEDLRENVCVFDSARICNQCFDCIGVINKKNPESLSILETARLLQFKLFNVNLGEFSDRINECFSRNGGSSEQISYAVSFDADMLLNITTLVTNKDRGVTQPIESLGEGMRSIYMLSLLEAYSEGQDVSPYIVMIEEPEMFLHPQLKKVASRVLYKLSSKNQVIFSTHEPEMLFNFTSKQIRQVYMNEDFNTAMYEHTDIDKILDDLGFTANDLLNVSFVFIVEGKQDKSRLPLLLKKYYSEITTPEGELKRISIIATNSCTNIKTYANLKYINSLYLKEQFMMIRDGDAKNPEILKKQLCKYYEDRSKEDKGNLPRVTEENVLILKYYSFENYFLFPEIMEKIGVVDSVDEFYDVLWKKYQDYLYKLSSVKKMLERRHFEINSRQDLIEHIEDIRTYVRGHNLYDIFYGRYKNREKEILTKYIELAPRSVFADILDKIDAFIFFDSRKLD